MIPNLYPWTFSFVILSFLVVAFSFPPREFPLIIVAKLVWQCLILLAFAYLSSCWFFLQIGMKALLGRVILFVGFFLSSLCIMPSPFWPGEFLLKNQLVTLLEFPCIVICCFSISAFSIFSLSLTLVHLMNMCLRVFLLGFILYDIHCVSWIWASDLFLTLGKFSAIISSNIFFGPFFSFLHPVIWMLEHLVWF